MAYALSLQKESLVMAFAEHVGAGQNAADNLGAKTFGPTAGHHVVDVLVVLGAVAIAYPIKPGQVAGSLGGANDVISRAGLVAEGNGHLDPLCTKLFEGCQGLFEGLGNLGVQGLPVKFLDEANAQALERGIPLLGKLALQGVMLGLDALAVVGFFVAIFQAGRVFAVKTAHGA